MRTLAIWDNVSLAVTESVTGGGVSDELDDEDEE